MDIGKDLVDSIEFTSDGDCNIQLVSGVLLMVNENGTFVTFYKEDGAIDLTKGEMSAVDSICARFKNEGIPYDLDAVLGVE